MSKQMTNSDLTAIFGKLWKKVWQRFVEGKFLAIRQDHHGHGGELFGDGCQAEIRICDARDSSFHIRQAIPFCEEDFALEQDRDACAGNVRFVVFMKESIYFVL